MPALPSPGKVIRVTLQFTDGSDSNILNRVYFSYTGSVSATDCTSINNTIDTAWGSHMATNITSNVALIGVTTSDLSSATGAEVTTTYNTAGSNAGTKLASGTSIVMQNKLARKYRGGHPRTYLAGMPEAALLNANTWVTATADNALTGWTQVLSAVVGSPPADLGVVAQVNVSYYLGFTVVTNPISGRARNVPKLRTTPVVDVVQSVGVNLKVGSQRRRNKQSP